MEQSFAPTNVIDKKRLKALAARSDTKGLAQLAVHVLALAATAASVTLARGTPWLVPALWLHGVVLIFVFAPLHETIHRTAFLSRRLNDAVARLCGLVLLLPPDYFRLFHFAHHRHTQDPAKDPELAVPKAATLAGYLWTVTGISYWRERLTTIPKHALGRVTQPFIPARDKAKVVREARLVLGIYGLIAAGSLAAGSWAAVIYWVIPVLLGQPALRLYLLAEHTGCPLVPDMLRNSRTTKSNALVRRLAWNMPYHTAHHAYPALPFHALPTAQQDLEDLTAVKAPGYLAVHREIIAGLRGSVSQAPAQP